MPATTLTLPLPPHFHPEQVETVWRVPYQSHAAAAETWAKTHDISPAHLDTYKICLLAIDVQNTFCIPGFELFVGGQSGKGAVEDNQRLCAFIYRNLNRITAIAPTLDTHTALQIFHPIFWVDAAGNHPEPLTMISVKDLERGLWQVNPAIAPSIASGDLTQLQQYAHHYVTQLSQGGKFPLIIWPYHSMLGGIGHALVSAFEEACFFHAIARQTTTAFEIKGQNPLTENYSVLRPEVLTDIQGQAIAHKNATLIQTLLTYDAVIIAGQAKSHCIAWTVDDLLSEIQQRDPQLAQKIYLLEDCTSPVVVPGVVDFTEVAETAFTRFANAGMHRVSSTLPLEDWPGMGS